MILSQSTDRTSSQSASFYLVFLTFGIFTTKGIKNNNNNDNKTSCNTYASGSQFSVTVITIIIVISHNKI